MLDPSIDGQLVVRLLSEITGRTTDDVVRQLHTEYRIPGATVAAEVRRRRITPFVHSEAMDKFYSESDAFLFESVIWNCNRLKHRMRAFVCKRLKAYRFALNRDTYNVLVIGDGPGFDTLNLACSGNRVTYHELPGIQEEFARKLFDAYEQDVHVVTDREHIPKGKFDTVICMDVLEHVDDPPAVVQSLVEYLHPEGCLIVHAPYYMIHPAYPTHLLANRKYSGSLALYRNAGLQLIDGQIGWNPLVFQRIGSTIQYPRGSTWKHIAMRIAGFYFVLGRAASFPFLPIHWARLIRGRDLQGINPT